MSSLRRGVVKGAAWRTPTLSSEVFDFDYFEIGVIIDRWTDNCRHMVRRARDRVGDGSRRFPVTPEREHDMVEVFLAARGDGDVERPKSVLVADIARWHELADRR